MGSGNDRWSARGCPIRSGLQADAVCQEAPPSLCGSVTLAKSETNRTSSMFRAAFAVDWLNFFVPTESHVTLATCECIVITLHLRPPCQRAASQR
jgi:hypothetical protein